MSGPSSLDTHDADDEQTRRWLSMLQSGSSDEKAQARRGLAEHFETRGLASEAIELLVANAREGYRDVELFQALARMYRQRGDEYLAASAALEATRLSGQQPASDRPATSAPQPVRDRQPTRPVSGQLRGAASGQPSPWRLPLRVAGWIVVVATVVAAAAVASRYPLSAALYVVSAGALVLLLARRGPTPCQTARTARSEMARCCSPGCSRCSWRARSCRATSRFQGLLRSGLGWQLQKQ